MDRRERGQSLDLKSLRLQRMLGGTNPAVPDEKRTVGQLSAELSAKTAEVAQLKGEKASIQSQLNTARQDLKSKTDLLAQKDREIAGLRQQAGRTTEMPNDPNGYYRALGLHPSFALGLTPTEARKVLQATYRVHSTIFHPDRGGNQDRMKKLNAAHDELVRIHGK